MWNRSSRTKSSEAQLSTEQQVYDKALELLSYRDYSEAQLLERLQQKGAAKPLAQAAIVKLVHYGLLNEERYAERVYEAWLAKRCYGRQHLAAELAKRGIRKEYAAAQLARFTPELEAEQAANAAQLFLQRQRRKLAGVNDPVERRKLYAAAARFLAARGFGSGQLPQLWALLEAAAVE